jgi:hypothetical protein
MGMLCPSAPNIPPPPKPHYDRPRLTHEQVRARYAEARDIFLAGHSCPSAPGVPPGSIRLVPGASPRLFERISNDADAAAAGDGVVLNRVPVVVCDDTLEVVGRDEGAKPVTGKVKLAPWRDDHPTPFDVAPVIVDGVRYDCPRGAVQ